MIVVEIQLWQQHGAPEMKPFERVAPKKTHFLKQLCLNAKELGSHHSRVSLPSVFLPKSPLNSTNRCSGIPEGWSKTRLGKILRNKEGLFLPMMGRNRGSTLRCTEGMLGGGSVCVLLLQLCQACSRKTAGKCWRILRRLPRQWREHRVSCLTWKGELVSPEFPISWLTVNARNLWPPGDTFGQVRSRSKDRKDTYIK